jgi:hypothetical protein
VVGAFAGLVLLWRRVGARAVPLAVAGFGAVPVLAFFKPLAYVMDARYSLPFMPALLVGLGAWGLLIPRRVVRSTWFLAIVPVAWIALCGVPAIHHEIRWTWADPNSSAVDLARALDARGVTALRGDYWGVYLLDYLAADDLDARPDHVVRFNHEAERADATPLDRTAYIYPAGRVGRGEIAPPISQTQYDLLTDGHFDLWIPR